MKQKEIIRMAQEAGALVYAVNAGRSSGPYKTGRFSGPSVEVIIDVLFTPETLEHFVALVAAAERKALANEFSEAVTKTLESLAATTLIPSPPMPMAIKNLNAIAAAVAAEREACAQIVERNAAACDNNAMLRDVLMSNAAAIRARGTKKSAGD